MNLCSCYLDKDYATSENTNYLQNMTLHWSDQITHCTLYTVQICSQHGLLLGSFIQKYLLYIHSFKGNMFAMPENTWWCVHMPLHSCTNNASDLIITTVPMYCLCYFTEDYCQSVRKALCICIYKRCTQ